jgi:hypothetical protein
MTSIKGTIIVIVLGVALFLGAGLLQSFSSTSSSKATEGGDAGPEKDLHVIVSQRQSTTSMFRAKSTTLAGLATGDPQNPGSVESVDASDAPTVLSGDDEATDTLQDETWSSPWWDLTDPELVIGNPFPLSESVKESCGEYPDRCKNEYEVLAQMALEPRDLEWARDMERHLRKHVLTSDSGPFFIRDLECRTRICALEIESMFWQFYDSSFRWDPHLKQHLGLDGGAYGYEKNSENQDVKVAFRLFLRRADKSIR